MRRYLTRSRANDDWYEADASASLARTVHEPDPTPYKIGILDAQGNAIWAEDVMQPIGFVRFGDG